MQCALCAESASLAAAQGLFLVADVCCLLLQAFQACRVQAAAPVGATANINAAVPPLKTAGIKWGAPDADAGMEADAAATALAAAAPQPPLQIAGIKWGAAQQPETAPSQVRLRPVIAS
jgi:hypothetical protein